MNGQSQDPTEQLLQSDEEFHELSAQHHALDEQIGQLTAKPHLSEPEHFQEITLKKRKLQMKDRMEDILRRHRHV